MYFQQMSSMKYNLLKSICENQNLVMLFREIETCLNNYNFHSL